MDQTQLNEATYLSLGRFVVTFSGLIHALITSKIHLAFTFPYGAAYEPESVRLNSLTAGPLVFEFIAAFKNKWDELISAEDLAIIECLNEELLALISERNRMMHDIWLSKTIGGHPGPHSFVRAGYNKTAAGSQYHNLDIYPDDIEPYTQTAKRLMNVVNCIAFYHRPGQTTPELSGRISLQNDTVSRM